MDKLTPVNSGGPAPTFGECLEFQAAQRPHAPAMQFEGRSASYAETDRLANRVANQLLREAKPGDRIAYLGKNSDTAVSLTLGVCKAGMVLVPIIWRLAPAEILHILVDSEARLLFVDRDLAPCVAEMPRGAVRIIQTEGSLTDDTATAFDVWLQGAPVHKPDVTIMSHDAVLQLYTSGTTGKPKGVVLSHANLTGFRQIIEATDLDWIKADPGERTLLAMPFGHIAGVGIALLAIISAEELVIHREYDADAVLGAIEHHRLKRLFLVPAALKLLLERPSAATTDFSSLEYFSYGASPIPAPLLEQALDALGCQFVQAYGMTETWGAIVALPPEDHEPSRRHLLASAGKALPGVEVRIRGGNGNIVPDGETGEIEVRSPTVMLGYWRQEAATRETLSADGWLRTGDAGMLNEEGYLFIQDRIKDMIISGAENVYPAEVESALYGHPDVSDVAVIGVPDSKWGEAVKAIVVPRPGSMPKAVDIIAYARERIAGYKCPKTIDFVEALPRNPSGKILRRELREPFWAGFSRRVN